MSEEPRNLHQANPPEGSDFVTLHRMVVKLGKDEEPGIDNITFQYLGDEQGCRGYEMTFDQADPENDQTVYATLHFDPDGSLTNIGVYSGTRWV